MKLIDRIEKSKSFWFLFLLLIFFFLLRFPSLFEPYWYGDEGITQLVAMSMRAGRLLYSDIWDNKPPLLYLIYAFFNADQFHIRTASLLIGLCAVIAFFFLSRALFKNRNIVFLTSFLFSLFLVYLLLKAISLMQRIS
jgi:hypothetical protein